MQQERVWDLKGCVGLGDQVRDALPDWELRGFCMECRRKCHYAVKRGIVTLEELTTARRKRHEKRLREDGLLRWNETL